MDITYAPSNSSIAYFSVDTSQIWKSTDGGSTWQHKSKGFLANGARSIIVDPKNPNIVFAAGFLGYDAARGSKHTAAARGIYRTTDGGEHWKLVRETEFFKQESKGRLFAFDSSSGDAHHTSIVFAGSYSEGLLKSTDGGSVWKCVGFKGKHIIDIEEDPSVPGRLLVATEEGLFRYSANSTGSLGKGLPSWPRSIAIHHQNPKIIYAAVGKHGVYKSTDGGKSFKPFNKGLPSSVFCADIACSPVNSNIVYVSFQHSGRHNPYYSHNGGVNWKAPTNTDVGNLSIVDGFWFSSAIAVHFTEAMTALVVGNGSARVLKTIDGGKNWAYSGNGFTGGRMRDIAFSKDGKMFFCLTDHGLFLTGDRGETFRKLKVKRIFGLESSCSAAINGNTIVASVGTWGKKGLEVSQDLGKTWKIFDKLVDSYHFIAFNSKDNRIIYAGPYCSRDRGKTWTKLTQTIRAMYAENGDIVYAISRADNKKCYILKSIDQGETWSKPYPVCPFSLKSVTDIAIAPDNPDRMYLATSNGLWIFDGKKWLLRNANHGLDKDFFGMCYISSVAVDPNHPKVIYVGRQAPGHGRSNGVFRSTDGGTTWKNISWNLGPELTIWSVSVSPIDSIVYLGTSLGTWKYTPYKKSLGSPKNLKLIPKLGVH
ncbi:MAG: hypothetical protein GWP10_19235 [Nitrospiraceae bacterium]|nr:hypothetical protein [Nitrospiraceae bacterium]